MSRKLANTAAKRRMIAFWWLERIVGALVFGIGDPRRIVALRNERVM